MESFVEVGRRQRKRQAVHQALLDAAEVLFREQGVSGTTVDDIAKAADVARQTVFNHFAYKEALALELASDGIQGIAQRAHTLLESGTDTLEVLYYTATAVLDLAIHQRELAVTVARELLHPDRDRAEKALQHVPLEDIFYAILDHAREEGTIREDLPLDAVASRLSSIVTGLVAQVLTYDVDRLRRDLSIFFDIVFNGIMKRSA